MRVSNLKIGQILINEGDITEEQLDKVLQMQKTDEYKGKRVADILIAEKIVTEQQVCKALEKQLLIPYVDLDELQLPEEVGNMIPEEMATNNQVVPIEKEGRFLTVAIADPLNYQGLKDISMATTPAGSTRAMQSSVSCMPHRKLLTMQRNFLNQRAIQRLRHSSMRRRLQKVQTVMTSLSYVSLIT